MTNTVYSLGIDPGWKNLGLALTKRVEDQTFLAGSAVLTPSNYDPIEFPEVLWKTVQEFVGEDVSLSHLTIERYVAYAGVSTSESENILMLIGGLRQYLSGHMRHLAKPNIFMLRAIDWKTHLVKTLVKTRGFDNPSSSLDKKFSIAAAHCCLDSKYTINTDHEADAICLSCIPLLSG